MSFHWSSCALEKRNNHVFQELVDACSAPVLIRRDVECYCAPSGRAYGVKNHQYSFSSDHHLEVSLICPQPFLWLFPYWTNRMCTHTHTLHTHTPAWRISLQFLSALRIFLKCKVLELFLLSEALYQKWNTTFLECWLNGANIKDEKVAGMMITTRYLIWPVRWTDLRKWQWIYLNIIKWWRQWSLLYWIWPQCLSKLTYSLIPYSYFLVELSTKMKIFLSLIRLNKW